MNNELFLKKANDLKPSLNSEYIELYGSDRILNKGDEIVFDLGNHYVGYVDISLSSVGHHMDAPLLLQINFAEIKEEFAMDVSSYHGWISESWIQEERVHIDTLPKVLKLERRYAFRFIKIKVVALSDNYSIKIDKINCQSVSSADMSKIEEVKMSDIDHKLDSVGIRTLHDCMQDVFEDGPKRDRRLWLGDLRLQALANYETFKNYDLVKRCLYLFASSTLENERLASNIFVDPEVECDYQAMFDYTLFFTNILWEYFEHSNDFVTLKELEPTCLKQYELLRDYFKDNLFEVPENERTFVDWNLNLDKKVAGQGIYIASLMDLVKIEKMLGKDTSAIEKEIVDKRRAVVIDSYDDKLGLFVSNGQLSYASQIWMVLSGTVSTELSKKILLNLEDIEAMQISSPYLMHYYIEALIKADLKDLAYTKMKEYWGKMIEMGGDTFFELFNPDDINFSPYGGLLVHSFCHAWSCTPTYFLRKYYY